MIEVMATMAKLMPDELSIEYIKDALHDIDKNGLTKETKNRLAVVCQLFLMKMAIGEKDLIEFVNDIKRRQTMAKAFDNKQ